jgi:hypothetical protein
MPYCKRLTEHSSPLLIGLHSSKSLQLESVRPQGKLGFMGTSVVANGQNSVVGVVTHCGLEGAEFEPRWGRVTLYPSRLAARPTQPPIQWVPGLFPRVKVARVWC